MNTENEANELQERANGLAKSFVDIYLMLKQLIPEDKYNELVSKSMFYDVLKDK